MRNDIINSIYEKIESYDEEIEKYDIAISNEQEKLRLMMNDEEITLEALIELKGQIFSASDAELRILEIEQEIKELQSKLSVSETSSEQTKNKREAVINVILKEMNTLYKAIDPNGNLVFEGLFTKKNVTKENAIMKITEVCGFSTDSIIAFGDDYADIGMLELCGTGVAMGNAIDEVKERADIVIGSNDEEGIADFIENEIL